VNFLLCPFNFGSIAAEKHIRFVQKTLKREILYIKKRNDRFFFFLNTISVSSPTFAVVRNVAESRIEEIENYEKPICKAASLHPAFIYCSGMFTNLFM
jgi:hypothetical protein